MLQPTVEEKQTNEGTNENMEAWARAHLGAQAHRYTAHRGCSVVCGCGLLDGVSQLCSWHGTVPTVIVLAVSVTIENVSFLLFVLLFWRKFNISLTRNNNLGNLPYRISSHYLLFHSTHAGQSYDFEQLLFCPFLVVSWILGILYVKE